MNELKQYAASKGYGSWKCAETSPAKRTMRSGGLRRIEELAAAGKIRKVLVHEISRIARRNSVAHKFVETLEQHGVSLYWHAQGIETLLPNGKRNPAAGIMLALLAEMARSEHELLKARIASGLAEACAAAARSLAGRLELAWRRQSCCRSIATLCALENGQSMRNAAKIAGKGISTVQRVKQIVSHR